MLLRNRNIRSLSVLIAIAINVAVTPVILRVPSATALAPTPEGAAWKRIAESGKIRCAYIPYEPYAIKDPNTKALSGIMVDAVEAIGKKLDLKIDWVEEVGYGTMFEGFETGRYDMLCSGVWQNSTRGKRAYFSTPLFFNPIRVWVRADETRFNTLADLNSAQVRIGVQDRAIEDIIAQQDFPKAQRVAIGQLNPWTEVLLNIITKKADVTFAEPGVITPFNKKNPGALKELPTPRPLRLFATSLPIKMGENEFKSVLDSAVMEILSDGTMEGILAKYEQAPGELLRVAPPYQEPRN
jgi:ABC-type amino acid transport substrate-binding protein